MRKRLAALLVTVLLLMLALPTGAAARNTPAPTDSSRLHRNVLKLSNDTPGYIVGLSLADPPIVTASVMPLLRELTSPEVVVLIADDILAFPDMPVQTGMEVRWSSEAPFTSLVVYGDVLGTGEMSLTQLTRMAAALNGSQPLEGAYLKAADVNGSGALDLTDLTLEAEAFSSVPDISAEDAEAIEEAAVALQTEGDYYNADSFSVVELKKGDLIYGMLPGQSAFYSDLSTVEECGGSYVKMYEKLQMLPHAEYGYREQLGVYEVNEDMWAAIGWCLANSEIDGTYAGAGGGVQYVVPDFESALTLKDTIELHE